LATGPGPACSQEEEKTPPTPEEIQAANDAPLFNSHEILELTLTAPMNTLRRQDRSDEDSEERPAQLEWTEPDGTTQIQEIQVQTRGIFRLNKRNCDFPPLRLNVKKGAVKGTHFDGQDKLKLVVPCKLNQDYWEQYVLSEYLAYRMLNVLTPLSFRVRLVRVTYHDSTGEDDPVENRFGFLIEDDSDMVARAGGLKRDWPEGTRLMPTEFEKSHSILVELFQYMIGNTDWSSAEGHNMELMDLPSGVRYAVPYDFDFSGIVDARYATPDPRLPIRSVRQRLYRGWCSFLVGRMPEDYEAAYELFREKKEEIYSLWRNQEGLESDRLEDNLEYLDEFYETLSDPEKIQDRMTAKCRKS
jgi:hypothetical protein